MANVRARNELLGGRVANMRRFRGQTQADTSKAVGITANQLGNIESGRTVLRFGLGWELCRQLNANQTWIAAGVGSEHPFLKVNLADSFLLSYKSHRFDEVCTGPLMRLPEWETFMETSQAGPAWGWSVIIDRTLEHLAPALRIAYMQKMLATHTHFLDKHAPELINDDDAPAQEGELEMPLRAVNMTTKEQVGLTSVVPRGSDGSMLASPTNLHALMRRLRRAFKAGGFTQNALAGDLKITRQAVNLWFTKDGLPGGEVALRLDAWLKARGY